MSLPVLKFNKKDHPEFIKELRNKVNNHFKENNQSRYANLNMKLKTAFMLALFIAPWILMITQTVTTLWPVIGMWVLMGLGQAGIGLSVMHDANHGSYSKKRMVNDALGYLINFIGGYHVNWKIQHNVLHHSYTNIEGFDEDISTPLLRFSPTQSRKPMHRFQAFYAPFLYGLMTLYWVTSKDFIQLVRYKKEDILRSQGYSFKKTLRQLIFNKFVYVLLTLGIPLVTMALPWWQIFLGYLLMQFICGLLLALIFQSAHIIEETDFYMADESKSMENNWAIHQIKTTSNFAPNSVIFSWFIGGLNYQIEHHLFPNICHVHYKKISDIVKETADAYNLPYYYKNTFFGAIRSHFTLLNQLGTGKYDRKLASA